MSIKEDFLLVSLTFTISSASCHRVETETKRVENQLPPTQSDLQPAAWITHWGSDEILAQFYIQTAAVTPLTFLHLIIRQESESPYWCRLRATHNDRRGRKRRSDRQAATSSPLCTTGTRCRRQSGGPPCSAGSRSCTLWGENTGKDIFISYCHPFLSF